MFGNSKIKAAKVKIEELKSKLEHMDFSGESMNGMVTIKCNGEKKFHSLEINDSLFKVRPREDIQLMILEAISEAQANADRVIQQEMSAVMPNIPGLGL